MSLLTLENRDVPAAWYTVHLDSPPQGTLGESAAHIASGGLTVDSSYDPDGDGTALVYAASGSEAIRLALTGSVTVDLTVINLPQTEYAFTEGTSSPSTSNHAAFAVTPTAASSTWKVYLEDLAATPTVSDWDCNDFFWTISVGVGTDPYANVPKISVAASSPWISATSGQPTTATIATPAPGPGVKLPPSWKTYLGTDANVAQKDFPELPAIDGLAGKDQGVKFVKLTTGKLGQNTTNPYPAFDNHVVVIFDGKIYDPSYGTSFTAGADLAANQLAFEKASIAGFVRLAARPVKYNDLKAQAGATEAFAYLYREHSGKLELKMLKMPNPNSTATPK